MRSADVMRGNAEPATAPAAASAAAAPSATPTPSHHVDMRAIPYPYRAMLAICSDLDETPDQTVYRETMRFLNTRETTAMGPGVGLEVGNTIYFDMPPDQFAYWNTDGSGRQLLCDLMRSGHVDCLHSFGDLATTRAHAERALDELARQGISLAVWIDHATATTNFGEDIMRGSGDVPGAAAYHADLTCASGVRYVWRGRVTSVIGQRAPRALLPICRIDHPLDSLRTVSKEFAKGVLGRIGSRKYRMHASNDVLREARLRSGHRVHEFLRANPHWAGVSVGETAAGLADVLSESFLRALAASGGVSILYTHLGKVADPARPIPEGGRVALRRLAAARDASRILVTTTRRLLDYCRVQQYVRIRRTAGPAGERLDVTCVPEPVTQAELQGLTIYAERPDAARVFVEGREWTDIQRNAPDETGRATVTLKWRPLEFPRL